MAELEEDLNYNEFFKKIRMVYSWLEDDASKELFDARLTFYHNGKTEVFFNNSNRIIQERANSFFNSYKGNYNVRKLSDIKLCDTETVIIYGAGFLGKIFFDYVMSNSKCNVLFCDRNYENLKSYLGKNVISPDELITNYKNNKII